MKEPKTYRGKLSIILQVAKWTADTDNEEEGEFLNAIIAQIQNELGQGDEILEKYGFEWEG